MGRAERRSRKYAISLMIFPNPLGSFYSYSNIELNVNGQIFAGVKAINYKDTLGRQFVRGTAMQPLGMTQGRYEAHGDIEMYLDAWSALSTALGPGWRQRPITATVSYGPNVAMPLPFIIDVIPSFFLGDVDASQSESEDALTRKFTMHIPTQILWGGIPSILEPQILAAVA